MSVTVCARFVVTAHHSDPLEIELGRRNIPFVKYGGLKFLEAEEGQAARLSAGQDSPRQHPSFEFPQHTDNYIELRVFIHRALGSPGPRAGTDGCATAAASKVASGRDTDRRRVWCRGLAAG